MKYAPGLALLLASWLQPLHVLPWVSWHSEVLAFAAVLWWFGAELASARKGGQRTFVAPVAVIVPLALAALALLQFATGLIQYLGDALIISLYLATCSMAVAVGHAWAGQPAQTRSSEEEYPLLQQLALVVLVAAVASVLIALVEVFRVWEQLEWIVRPPSFRRPGGNIGQPNNLATLVLMGVASLAYLFEGRRVSASLAAFLMALLTLGLAMTESRTALLSAAALSAWWFYKRRLLNAKVRPAALAAAWAGWLILLWAWPQVAASFHFVDRQVVDTTPGLRLVVWPQFLEAAMQHPWFGWGLREVSRAHNAVLDHYQSAEPFTYAHNIVLDFVVGMGFPLTVLVLGGLTYWACKRLRAVQSPATWYCVALAIPLSVHAMLEYPFAYAYLLFPVMLAVGYLEGSLAPNSALKVATRWPLIATPLVLALMVWSALEYVRAEEDFRIARFEALRIGKTQDDYTQPELYLLTQLKAMLAATRMTPKTGMSSEDIELLRRAATRFPWTAIQNRYALALALNGNPDEAMRQLRVMRAMHGEKHYKALKAAWQEYAQDKYPQLAQLALP